MSLEQQIRDLTRNYNALKATVDRLVKPEVGQWVDWTPTVTQSGSVTVTVTAAEYKLSQGKVDIYCHLTVTGTGTAGNDILVGGWPAAIAPSPTPVYWPVGTGVIVDSGTEAYEGVVSINDVDTTKIALRSPTTNDWIGSNPSFALASSDQILFNMHWRT